MNTEFPHVKETIIALSPRVSEMKRHELGPDVSCINVCFHMSLVCCL
jgi:hypothetical protein